MHEYSRMSIEHAARVCGYMYHVNAYRVGQRDLTSLHWTDRLDADVNQQDNSLTVRDQLRHCVIVLGKPSYLEQSRARSLASVARFFTMCT